MPGLIIKGKEVQVPGLKIVNYNDDPSLRLTPGKDCRPRHTTWVRGIVLHTTKGIPGGKDKRAQLLKPGISPNTDADNRTANWWSKSDLQSGAHLVCDFDGSWACLADLFRETAFHAGQVNEYTIGIEIYQGKDAELYEGQLLSVVTMLDALTRLMGIQRQFHAPYKNGPIRRLEKPQNGEDVVGIYGHRDATNNRGFGDPGDYVFEFMKKAGYEAFDFFKAADKIEWKTRQLWLNSQGNQLTEDGIPGPGTVKALQKAGKPHGMWVKRPGD